MQTDNLARDLVINILMLQGIGVGHNLNGPSWSISTEFLAYLFFPVFLYAVFHRKPVVWAMSLLLALAGLCTIAFRRPYLGSTPTAGFRRHPLLLRIRDGPCRVPALCHPPSSFPVRIRSRYGEPDGGDGRDHAVRLGDLFAVLLFPLVIIGFAHNQSWPARLMAPGFRIFSAFHIPNSLY